MKEWTKTCANTTDYVIGCGSRVGQFAQVKLLKFVAKLSDYVQDIYKLHTVDVFQIRKERIFQKIMTWRESMNERQLQNEFRQPDTTQTDRTQLLNEIRDEINSYLHISILTPCVYLGWFMMYAHELSSVLAIFG